MRETEIRGIARPGYQDYPQGRKMTPMIEGCIVEVIGVTA